MSMDIDYSNPKSNGHLPPLVNSMTITDDAPYESDSDLSDVREPPPVAATSLSAGSTPNRRSEFGHEDIESEQPSEDDDNASDDGDFDMEDSPAVALSHVSHNERSSSHDSRRPQKRKLGVEEDEHIKANPELYGLRRSVCFLILSSPITTNCCTGPSSSAA